MTECKNCGGRGKVRDFKDRDPIEGYKLAPWYPCQACGSTGKKEIADVIKNVGKNDLEVGEFKAWVDGFESMLPDQDEGLTKHQWTILRAKISELRDGKSPVYRGGVET